MTHENLFTEALRKRREMDLPCYNTLIIANPGEGGHFVMKTDIMDILQNTNDDVVVIDAFGGYGPELEEIGAKRIKVAPGGCLIDPLYRSDLISFDENEDMATAANLFLAMMKSMGLLPSMLHMSSANIAIENAIKRAYEGGNKTMSSILAELAKEDDSQIKLFVHWLSRFDYFDDAPLNLSSRCIIVCADSLNKELKTAAVMMILNNLLSAIYEKFRKTGKQTWVCIPHLDALLERDTDEFIPLLLRRLRKYGGICVGSVRKDPLETRIAWHLFNCVYLLNPSQKAEAWLEALDIAPGMVNSLTQMVYTLGGEVKCIPPHNPIEFAPSREEPEKGMVFGSSGRGMSFMKKIRISKKRAD